MKTITLQLAGTPTAGDLVIVGYRGRRGGQSAVKCVIVSRKLTPQPDKTTIMVETGAEKRDPAIPRASTLEEMAAALASEINKGKEFLPNEFSAKTKGAMLVVNCSDLVSDVDFFAEVEGAQTETVVIDTF